MKCPVCVEEDRRSTVQPVSSATTAMIVHSFYDEEGKWHYHDPNAQGGSYECSNGHRFGWSWKQGCKSCGEEGRVDVQEYREGVLVSPDKTK